MSQICLTKFRQCALFTLALALLLHQAGQAFASNEARLVGSRRIGVHPGTPLVHTVGSCGVSGVKTFSASNLPKGLSLDRSTGILSGSVAAGTHNIHIVVEGEEGSSAEGFLQIESGDRLALTPPMGFNSWNSFEGRVSGKVMRSIADALVASGLREAGYQYVNIDDTWSKGRNSQGRLVPDPERFAGSQSPEGGIRELAESFHAKGLKLGIYADAGTKTCAGYEGSYGHEVVDAKTFASWNVDYVKHDYCNAPTDRKTAVARYSLFGQTLKNSNRSIIYSVCEWGQRSPWEWAGDQGGAAAHLWRTSYDMRDHWGYNADGSAHRAQKQIGILDAVDLQVGLEKFNGPGGWNDPDMMVVGVDLSGSSAAHSARGLNAVQEQSHFSMWAMWSSPLILNADLRKLDPQSEHYDPAWTARILPILANHEVIAINQDPLGRQASCALDLGDQEVWTKSLANGDVAVALLNRAADDAKVAVSLSQIGLSGSFRARNLWSKADLGIFSSNFEIPVNGYATTLLRLAPIDQGDVTGDGVVDQRDVDYLEKHLGSLVTICSLREGDIDGDGAITTRDIEMVQWYRTRTTAAKKSPKNEVSHSQ